MVRLLNLLFVNSRTMKEIKINVPFALITCFLSVAFSVGIFYAKVENRLHSLEESKVQNNDVRERVIRIETKMDLLLNEKTAPK